MLRPPLFIALLVSGPRRPPPRFLENEGGVVERCVGLDTACAYAGNVIPDLVLIDIDALSADAAHGVRRVRRAHPGSALVIDGNLADPAFAAMLLDAGADDVIAEWCPLEERIARIRRLVGCKRAELPPPAQTWDVEPGARTAGEGAEDSPALEHGRFRLSRSVHATRSLDPDALAQPFLDGADDLLPGFTGLLNLQQYTPGAGEQLAELIQAFDPGVEHRLAALSCSIAERNYRTVLDVIEGRGYRRVHSAAVGAAAVLMWGFDDRSADEHWRHALATAFLASLAGEDEDGPAADQAFAAGLLHEMGRLALVHARADLGNPLHAEDAGRASLMAEAAGRVIATELGLPLWLRDALTDCGQRPHPAHSLQTRVSASCWMAIQMGFAGPAGRRGVVPDRSEMPALHAALGRAGGIDGLSERVDALFLTARNGLHATLLAA